MIIQSTLLVASLFAATACLRSRWLRAYLWMAAGLATIELILLVAGFPVTSGMYASMWTLYNVAMLLFATAYAKPSMIAMLSAVGIFWVIGEPSKWYLWLSGAKGLWCLALGLTLVIDGSGAISQTIGLYWVAAAAWYVAFTKFDGSTWTANWWLPSTLSILGYSAIGLLGRRT